VTDVPEDGEGSAHLRTRPVARGRTEPAARPLRRPEAGVAPGIEPAPPRPLIVRLPNYVGDVVLSVPALKLLQDHGHRLHLVGKGWAASLLAAYRWPVSVRAASLLQRVGQLRQLRRDARAVDPGFDRRENTLVLPHAFSGALDPWLAGLRAVGSAAEARSWMLARAEPLRWHHAVEQSWLLACRFLRIERPLPRQIELATSPHDLHRADAALRRHGVRPGFIAVCPFAGNAFDHQPKTWPDFPAFARALGAGGRDVVCCPGPGEAALAAEQYPGVTSIADVDLGAYGGILRRASLVVANDTGPGHIAAAVGVPVVSVLGPTVPAQWAPWGPTVTIVRHWPRWPTVDEVLAAARAV
jgi:heptosyltransferase-2